MSLESLHLVSHLAGARAGPPAVLYADEWPGTWRRLAQRVYQAGLWLRCLAPGSGALMLRGPGLPAGKGPITAVPFAAPWNWPQPVVVLPGGDWSHLLAALNLDAEPRPELLLADHGVVVGLGCSDGVPTVVHACADEGRLLRYAGKAGMARKALATGRVEHLVPAMFGIAKGNRHACLAQQRMRGRSVRAKGLPASELERVVKAALAPLSAISRSGELQVGGADAPWIEAVQTSLSGIADWAPWLRHPLAALPRLGVRHRAPAVFVHGDYWLSNLLFEPDAGAVSAILDWERARSAGLSGFDALYVVVFAFSAWRGCAPLQVPAMIWDDLCEPTLDRLLDAAQSAVGLSRQQMAEVALAFWLGHLYLHQAERHRWSAQRHADWLIEPGRAAARWLVARERADCG